jgi:hypothetical protein
MVRRTVSLPESTDALVRELTEEGESFSAAVTRLIEAGAAAVKTGNRLSYIGSAEGPGDEIGLKAEEYLREILVDHDKHERPQL